MSAGMYRRPGRGAQPCSGWWGHEPTGSRGTMPLGFVTWGGQCLSSPTPLDHTLRSPSCNRRSFPSRTAASFPHTPFTITWTSTHSDAKLHSTCRCGARAPSLPLKQGPRRPQLANKLCRHWKVTHPCAILTSQQACTLCSPPANAFPEQTGLLLLLLANLRQRYQLNNVFVASGKLRRRRLSNLILQDDVCRDTFS